MSGIHFFKNIRIFVPFSALTWSLEIITLKRLFKINTAYT